MHCNSKMMDIIFAVLEVNVNLNISAVTNVAANKSKIETLSVDQ